MIATQEETATYQDFEREDYYDKMFVFELAEKRSSPVFTKYDGTPIYYPKRRHIKLEDTVYDHKARVRRKIKYIEGAMSIFVDEQPKVVLGANDRRPKDAQALFKNGFYYVPGTNTKLIEFLMLTDLNTSNPTRDKKKTALFKFVDKSFEFRKIMEKETLEQEAITWCNNQSFDKVLSYARVLMGIRVDNMDAMEVRYNMKRFAKSRPARFMSDMDVPKIVRKGVILEAVAEGILVVNETTRSVAWQDHTNVPIVTAPVGVNPVDHLVEVTFTVDGELILAAVKEFLTPRAKMVPASEIINTQIPTSLKPVGEAPPLITINEIKDKELEELFDKCVNLRLITKKTNWYSFKTETSNWKAMGKPKFVNIMRMDKGLLDGVRAALHQSGN